MQQRPEHGAPRILQVLLDTLYRPAAALSDSFRVLDPCAQPSAAMLVQPQRGLQAERPAGHTDFATLDSHSRSTSRGRCSSPCVGADLDAMGRAAPSLARFNAPNIFNTDQGARLLPAVCSSAGCVVAADSGLDRSPPAEEQAAALWLLGLKPREVARSSLDIQLERNRARTD